jgi:hypothetical protein
MPVCATTVSWWQRPVFVPLSINDLSTNSICSFCNNLYIATTFGTSFTKSRRLQAMSISNTRFKRVAHVIEACFSAGVWSIRALLVFSLPRFAGVTSTDINDLCFIQRLGIYFRRRRPPSLPRPFAGAATTGSGGGGISGSFSCDKKPDLTSSRMAVSISGSVSIGV